MKRAGRKTNEWDRVRRELKPQFERAGITACEFVYIGCWYDNGLSFAHAKKRGELKRHELSVVALACAPCHDKLERLRHDTMYKRVMGVIKHRAIQPH